MIRKSLSLALIATIGALGATSAFAAPGHDGPMGKGPRMGPGNGPEVLIAAIILDTDKDGVLSGKEVAAAEGALEKMMDKPHGKMPPPPPAGFDKPGKGPNAEKGKPPMPTAPEAGADERAVPGNGEAFVKPEGPGKMTVKPPKPPVEDAEAGPIGKDGKDIRAMIFAKIDADGDGAITLEEFQAVKPMHRGKVGGFDKQGHGPALEKRDAPDAPDAPEAPVPPAMD